MISTDAIAAMKLMASEPKKRGILLKDSTCVGGLVIVLSNSDSTIVKESLETLNLLCESQEGPRVLKGCMGMQDQLAKLIRSESSCSIVKELALQLQTKIFKPKESTAPLKDVSNTSRKSTGSRNASLSSVQAKAKSIVLQIRGLYDKTDRDLCARLVLKCKGVISITFDLSKKRCILRTKLDVGPEILAASIAKSMTMEAQQVVKNEKGDESFINFTGAGDTHCQSNIEKEPNDLPDYLSDDNDNSIIDDKALKRPSKEDQKKSNSWFGTATSFLSNSFYW